MSINDDLISRNLGKTLVLIWRIQTCKRGVDLNFNSYDRRIVANLFYVLQDHVRKFDITTKIFGDRINVTWVDTYFKVELKHLQNNDAGNFSVRSYDTFFSSYPSSILITETQGMYRFFFQNLSIMI